MYLCLVHFSLVVPFSKIFSCLVIKSLNELRFFCSELGSSLAENIGWPWLSLLHCKCSQLDGFPGLLLLTRSSKK